MQRSTAPPGLNGDSCAAMQCAEPVRPPRRGARSVQPDGVTSLVGALTSTSDECQYSMRIAISTPPLFMSAAAFELFFVSVWRQPDALFMYSMSSEWISIDAMIA